jgi:hypothetical protein
MGLDWKCQIAAGPEGRDIPARIEVGPRTYAISTQFFGLFCIPNSLFVLRTLKLHHRPGPARATPGLPPCLFSKKMIGNIGCAARVPYAIIPFNKHDHPEHALILEKGGATVTGDKRAVAGPALHCFCSTPGVPQLPYARTFGGLGWSGGCRRIA